MAKFKMDAVEVASSIHKGDFSKLRGKSFEMCDNTNMGKKYTLNQLGSKVDKLESTVNQLASKVDQISDVVLEMSKDLKRVDNRLDYIVSANNLKDLPKSKQ